MKVIILSSLLIILSSCFGSKFKLGDCIQKPDEASIWKITAFNEGMAELTAITKGTNVAKKEVALPGSYLKARCH